MNNNDFIDNYSRVFENLGNESKFASVQSAMSEQINGVFSYEDFLHYISQQKQKNPIANQFLKYFLHKKGIKLIIKENDFGSYTDRFKNKIELGVYKSDYYKTKMGIIGLTPNTSNIEHKYYTLLHEVSHNLLWYMHDNQHKFKSFVPTYLFLKTIREKNHQLLGLSKLGSERFYIENPEVREDGTIIQRTHDEDFVELLTMYIYDTEGFMRIMDLLSSPHIPQQKGLVKLSPNQAEAIKQGISNCVQDLIRELQ